MIALISDTENIVLNESMTESDAGTLNPRISRTATLDGGAVISTSGCSHADRTMTVVAKNIPFDAETALRRITKQAAMITLCNAEGAFTGYVDHLDCKSGDITFTFLVFEKLTPD